MESEVGEKGMVEFYQRLINRQKTKITYDQIDGTVENNPSYQNYKNFA